MNYANPKTVYACVDLGVVYVPNEIDGQSICINGDIREVLKKYYKCKNPKPVIFPGLRSSAYMGLCLPYTVTEDIALSLCCDYISPESPASY